MLRPPKTLRLSGPEILALVTLIKPFSVPGSMNPFVPFNFCAKLYEAGRRLLREEVDYADIPLSQGEAFLINQQVQLEDFETANMLLLQTWDILREWEAGVPEVIESGLTSVELDPLAITEQTDEPPPTKPKRTRKPRA